VQVNKITVDKLVTGDLTSGKDITVQAVGGCSRVFVIQKIYF
jgi:hypothetical protein